MHRPQFPRDTGTSNAKTGVSFVVPCLDEAGTLLGVLEEIEAAAGALVDRPVEILVADNGSTDHSRRIARDQGARVVDCPVRGYGAALREGIRQARHPIVVYADADGSYDFGEAPRLVARLEEGFDMVIGSRLRGTIDPGAMPWMHRYVGTPVLTLLLNRLYGARPRMSDCNSGLRCVRQEAFVAWSPRANGMEFASELIVKALAAGARISEVPIRLRRDRRDRTPHLSRWRDGMRHLLTILSGSPRTFLRSGATVWVLSWIALWIGLVAGPVVLPRINAFGIHTMMFALLGSCFGVNVFGIGLLLVAREGPAADARVEGPPSHGRVAQTILHLDEGRLFWGSVGFCLLSLAFFMPILVDWARADFRFLDLQKETLVLVAFGANGLFLLFNVIAVHLIKQP